MLDNFILIRNIVSWCLLYSIIGAFGFECDDSDFKYQYTECDDTNQRLRVAIPLNGKHCDNTRPIIGINCSFFCPAGKYLDDEKQECRTCGGGQYSLGGGIRYDEFLTLPHGFSTENLDASVMGGVLAATEQPCPASSGWEVKDGELSYSPSACISRLSFSVNLARNGFIEFTYRMPRNNRNLNLQVDVRNEQCQNYRDVNPLIRYRHASKGTEVSNGDWKRRTIDLAKGQNVISWTVTNSEVSSYSTEPIRISKIDVQGLAFIRQCSLCPAGTYSEEGAADCIACEPGYYSTKGAKRCGKCPESQYSGVKATKCIDRPACRQSDFYPVIEPCVNGQTRTTYKKVQPAVCRADLPGAAKLPQPSEYRPCPKCNPGMAKDEKGVCAFCPVNHFSDGNECNKCPVDTVPNYGYQLSLWDVLPSFITTRCEYISEEVNAECDIGEAWLTSGSAITSAQSLRRGIALEMLIDIPEGFNNPLLPHTVFSAHNPVAQLTIVYETSCADPSCSLYFIEYNDPENSISRNYRFLNVVNGTLNRRVWTHSILKKTAAKYMIAFLRSGAGTGDDAITDEARILSINITNVGKAHTHQGGGASLCQACPHNQNGNCIPCPTGHIMKDKVCVPCDSDEVVKREDGVEKCDKCGKNMYSKDGSTCIPKPNITFVMENRTSTLDFTTWLNKTWVVEGVRIFARDGGSSYHLFNISAINKNVVCKEDLSYVEQIVANQGENVVEGLACRVTVFPVTGKNGTNNVQLGPLLLSNRLEAIKSERTHGIWKLNDKMLEYDKIANDSLPLDTFFWYESMSSLSDACPNGTVLVIIARCSTGEEKARLPISCPDGTCDGCVFNVIIESRQACPLCSKGDYQQIRGECLNGKQTVHLIPDKHCVLSGATSDSYTTECSVLSPGQRMLITVGSVLFGAMTLILFMLCKRNRRLEYKYTRLVESHTGELPAAESCGLDEDEDDEDRVIFSKGKKKFFGVSSQESASFVPLQNDD